MTCTCCETVACCNGPSCNEVTRSQCAFPFNGTPSNIVGTCAPLTCVTKTGYESCTQENGCSCDSKGKRTLGFIGGAAPTCNCNTLAPYATNGGCAFALCFQCDSATGNCVYTCPSPRTCCAGTCCPLPQKCVNDTCVDKCAAGTTFCAGNGAAFDCCGANTKCCGASGCLPSQTSTNFSLNVNNDGWLNTGVNIPAGATVTITAAGVVEWRLPVSDPIGPNGTDLYPVDGGCNPLQGVAHMRLIGRVGEVMFSVGTSYTGQPGPGLLELRQNDNCAGDNEGFYTGTITVVGDPCPGFTPAAIGEPIVYGAGEKPVKPGPGAALKSLLSVAGIVSSPTCSCNARAAQMDSWGDWESLKRTPAICDWLKEEADKRNMWFFRPAGYALVLAAVLLSALKRLLPGNNK